MLIGRKIGIIFVSIVLLIVMIMGIKSETGGSNLLTLQL